MNWLKKLAAWIVRQGIEEVVKAANKRKPS